MKRTLSLAMLLACPLFAFGADRADDFAILSQKNIFMRDRQPPPDPSRWASRPHETPRPYVPDPPAKSFVLRGVVIEDNELHAYIENTRTGDVTRLVPGDAVADGHCVGIALDAIAYEQKGNVQWIDIGQNLLGSTVAAPPPTTAPAGSTTAPSTGPSSSGTTASDPALSSIEQRLRERRMRTQRNSK